MYSEKSLKIANLKWQIFFKKFRSFLIVISESQRILVNPIVIFLWVYNSKLKKGTKIFFFQSWQGTECIFVLYLMNIVDGHVLYLQKTEHVRPPGAIGADVCL